MPGARRSKLFLTVTCPVLCWQVTAGIYSADAVELGNMLFPSIEQQSRQASALALDAIATALKGIAELERNKSDISRGLLRESTGQLSRAAQEMGSVLLKETGDQKFKQYLDEAPNVEGISKPDLSAYGKSLEMEKRSFPKTRREAFQHFIDKTRDLSTNLDKPQRLSSIGDYLKLGDLVTRLMRQR